MGLEYSFNSRSQFNSTQNSTVQQGDKFQKKSTLEDLLQNTFFDVIFNLVQHYLELLILIGLIHCTPPIRKPGVNFSYAIFAHSPCDPNFLHKFEAKNLDLGEQQKRIELSL